MLELIPKEAYIEIYDFPIEFGIEETTEDEDVFGIVARNILVLPDDRVHFENRPGLYSDYLPDIPKHRPVRLGGAWGEACVKFRRIAYLEAGFTNVEIIPELTVYERDQTEFEKLKAMGNT